MEGSSQQGNTVLAAAILVNIHALQTQWEQFGNGKGIVTIILSFQGIVTIILLFQGIVTIILLFPQNHEPF